MASKRIIRRAVPEPEQEEEAPVLSAPDDDYMTGSLDDGDGELIRAGWGASQETIDSTSKYAQTFKPTKDTQIIKFLDGKPYASFRRHWMDHPGVGKRAYTCLQSVGKQCPLCDMGDRPGAVTAFNIALCSDDGEAVLKSWETGVKITQQLKTYSNDPKIGPLDKRTLYFAVSMSEASQRQQKTTMVNPVRERDLQEDWNTPPLSDAQLAKLKENGYTADIVEIPTRHRMEEVAAEFAGDEGPKQERGWGE
jgi:hypothetical protein